MFKRFKKLAAVAAVVMAAGLGPARVASAGVVPTTLTLDTFLDGGKNAQGMAFGDKFYSNFTFSSTGQNGGTVLDAGDVEMIFAEEDNTQFLAFLLNLDAGPGQRADVVIGYDVTVLDPARHIKGVGLLFDGGPNGAGANGLAAASVAEIVRTLDGTPLRPGSPDDNFTITVFNNGDAGEDDDNFDATLAINPARGLHFEKDILVSSRANGDGAGLSVVENSVTQNGPTTAVPLPAAAWAAMPVFGALVGGKKIRRLVGGRK
jgi:hypothetical protein